MGSRDDWGSTQSSSGVEIGVFDQVAPLVAYVQANAPAMLKLYSLRDDTTKHILRFGSQILKFQTSETHQGEQNRLLVLLSEGQLKIFNIQTMEQEMSIRTF
jgi:hypothetical protein